jgi:hypothetical protein
MRHLRHPATVVSIVALFAALSGGAIAGTLISGSQIKNHSIAAKKLTAGAIQQLRGHRGPAGPTGAQGTAGASGPAGIDSVHTFSGHSNVSYWELRRWRLGECEHDRNPHLDLRGNYDLWGRVRQLKFLRRHAHCHGDLR